jgi:hypothetical protein
MAARYHPRRLSSLITTLTLLEVVKRFMAELFQITFVIGQKIEDVGDVTLQPSAAHWCLQNRELMHCCRVIIDTFVSMSIAYGDLGKLWRLE